MITANQFAVGADETGQVVLYAIGQDGRATPVSEQAGTWDFWMLALDEIGAEPGSLIPVELGIPSEAST